MCTRQTHCIQFISSYICGLFGVTFPVEEKKSHCMERAGVLQPARTSQWAAPVVPILKRNAQINIWGASNSQ